MKKSFLMLLLTLCWASHALAVVAFQDDFSSDNGTMVPYLSDVSVGGGICTIDPNLNNAYTGAYSKMGGYSTDFGLGFCASIDVYLDVNIPDQNGFDLSMALNKTDGNHAQDFIFHVGKEGSDLWVNANNNSSFDYSSSYMNDNGGAYGIIPASGWYTFKITWLKNDPNIDVTFEVMDASGTPIWSLNRPTNHTPISQVGGNRYLWFTYHDNPLVVDNVILQPFAGSTHAAKNVTATSADLSGAISYNGDDNFQCRYQYWTDGGPIMATDWTNISLVNFTHVTGLTPNTEYSYKIEVKNSMGSYLAAYPRSFTTLSRIVISSTNGGTATPQGSFEYEAGTVIDVNAVADLGYGFSWTGSAVEAGLVTDPNAAATTVEVTGDLTLVANFILLPKIEWVTETIDIDGNNTQDDQDWIDLLTDAGYYVEVQRDRYTSLGDEKDVNDANDYVGELNAADLVIISRSTHADNYTSDANEIAAWNSVQSPIICLNANLLGSNHLKWVDSDSTVNDNTLPFMSVSDVNGPLFADVNVVDGLVDMVDTTGLNATTFINTTSTGNATVLGSHLAGYPWIAEWDFGTEYYDGSGQIAGGKRMMFMAGTKEIELSPFYYPQGALNLTEAGTQVFLNAVAYMLQFKPVDPGTANLTHLYTFEDGTADDLVGDANGTLVGDANNIYIADGALVTTAQDVWMSMPGNVIDINSYDAATIECWYTPTAGANTSWSMLAYLGSNAGGVGQNGWFITSARADNKCRAAISTGSTSPWADETGVDRPGNIDDGMLHQMVSTLDANEITLYIDGVLIGAAPMPAHNSISDLSNSLVYLAKGGYDGDPEWIGQIQKFSIYNKSLSDMEVLFLYLQGE